MILSKKTLGKTQLSISPMGLGAFKIGRNRKVKYPQGDGYQLIDNQKLQELILKALEVGINFIDVAPSYGIAEKRIGDALTKLNKRNDFVISTKVGEIFDGHTSIYDFSKTHIQKSIEQSLSHLKVEYLDLVFLHCPRDDLNIIQSTDAIEVLINLKERGLIQAIGVSTASIDGGLFAAEIDEIDALMVAFNIQYQDEIKVIQKAKKNSKGVLIKKALLSGNLNHQIRVEDCLKSVFEIAKADSVIIGTDKINHLTDNAAIISQLLNQSQQ